MELRQLEYLITVAEEANFTRAAERLHVAQPAVSAQLLKLERELGQPLLDRTRRTIRTTAAGDAALGHARAALAAVADLRSSVDALSNLLRGTLTIGTVTAHYLDMSALLADYHHAHPGVEITLTTDSSDVLIDELRSGRIDLAVVSIGSDEHPDGLGTATVTDERIEAVVGHDDPWARRARVTVSELAARPLIVLPEGTGIRRQLDAALRAAGVRPRFAFAASTPVGLADLAARNLGVAIVPESVTRVRTDVHRVTITPELRGRLVLAWRAAGPSSPAARAMLAMARQLLPVGPDA